MRQAFKDSTVWFYQVLARRAGYERMQQFINKVGYGNRQIGSAADIDRFWLQPQLLQITPKEQIKFLQRLYQLRLHDVALRIWVYWLKSTNHPQQ